MSDSTSSAVGRPLQARDYDLTEAATKKVVKRLVPFLLLMYVIAFLDRSNVGFAQKEFEIDYGISTAAYALGAGLFFVGYAIFEIPSNILMHRVGARWWMARIMVSWGIVAAAFMFVRNEWTFYIGRVLLGITEAGFFPGVILYLTYWIPARHLSRARGIFYLGIALAGIIGNPLSGALLQMDQILGLRGIEWMFLIEGLLAVIIGVISYWFLTDRPKDAHWLPDDEREALIRTLETEDNAKATGEGPQTIVKALGNWRVWYFSLIYFCIQIAVYGVTFFLPSQVTAITGQKLGFQAALVTAVPWVFGLIAALYFPGLADRTRKHRLIGTLLLIATGVGVFISGIFANTPVVAIAGLSLAACGFVAMQPIFWVLPTEYMTGYAAAAGIGLINSLGNLGGFLAPNMRAGVNRWVGDPASQMGLYSLGVGALVGALLFAVTGLFKKANEVESGRLETVEVHEQAAHHQSGH